MRSVTLGHQHENTYFFSIGSQLFYMALSEASWEQLP